MASLAKMMAGMIIVQLGAKAYNREEIVTRPQPKIKSFLKLYLSCIKPMGIARRVLPNPARLFTDPS
jgi:hypothetical protein